ncbi:winged helix-turn-helix domain-containing protein [Neobacillus sp. WH10]|uniref:winged helix-turn-helix domain-containing protein n=1 Tax=Neobacillus sp. WH10 TaxID=3047873 RepID=UPI0024C1158A|nr:winged helix-turn-helix domain-containing protein [Neobacillus sp. WH10]WHY79847.1 winged helix-turn-helix domain-containing protein [Neobacillus sp. WH10]
MVNILGKLTLTFKQVDIKTFKELLEFLKVDSMNIQIEKPMLYFDDFILNYDVRTVIGKNGEIAKLTTKEIEVLYMLATHKGRVFTKEQIYKLVWNYDNIPDSKNLTLVY